MKFIPPLDRDISEGQPGGPAIQIDPARLAVMGDSSGGNMAAAVTLLAKERGGPKIGFQGALLPSHGRELR